MSILRKQELLSESEESNEPSYDQIFSYLEKSCKLIDHYSKENFDLKEEIKVHKDIRKIMENDYSDIKTKMNDLERQYFILDENTNKINKNKKSMINILKNIGIGTPEEYKTKSLENFKQFKQSELDCWNSFKNSNQKTS